MTYAVLFFLLAITFVAGSFYGRFQERESWLEYLDARLGKYDDIKYSYLVVWDVIQFVRSKGGRGGA